MFELLRVLLHLFCSLCGQNCEYVQDLEFENQELQGQLDYINRDMQIEKAKSASRAGRMPK